MTDIAQWGKSECELDCKLPGDAVARDLELEAAAADAEAADAKDAEAAAADDEDAMDDVTESAYVVSAGHLVYSRTERTDKGNTHELH